MDCVPEINAVKVAETSLLEPGEILIISPSAIVAPSFLDNSRRTEFRFSPLLWTKIEAVSSSPT